MSTIAQFASFVTERRPVSDAVREAVRLHVIDTVGALIAGAATADGQMLLRYYALGARDLPRDLMTLTALARLTEIDDIHLAAMITPGAIVIPGALAIAAAPTLTLPRERGREGWGGAAALLDAIVAGYEAMIRLGLALDGPTILYRGIWPTYLAAPFGIAAVAARLLQLDAAQTANALALALTCAAPGVGHHNAPTTARWLAVGQAARNGLAAAQAVQAGFTADVGVLDGGFFPGVYAITPNVAAFSDRLGERATVLELSFKPWCAARQTMPATQALKEIIAEGVPPDSIASIKASIIPSHRRMIDHGVTPGDRFSYLTSLPYQMAAAAAAPQLADVLSPAPEAVPESVHALMRKITVAPDDALLADYPRIWPAHVAVTMATGVCEKRVTAVPGDPSRPLGEAAVVAKFRRFVTPVLGEERANAMLATTSEVMAGNRSPNDLLNAILSMSAHPTAPATRPR
jgi:2-methylcitrate dehydratase PrpD